MTETLLLGVVGSTAHGLAREGSDIDLLGAFVAPTLEISGLDWHSKRETHATHEPDVTLHEVGKMLRLMLKANPTVLELLFLEDYRVKTPVGQQLIELRSCLIDPRAVKSAYMGYASSQIQRFDRNARNGKVERKTARHTLRLVEQGTRLLTEGSFSIRVEDPQRYFDLDEMDFEDVVEYLNKELQALSDLPEEGAPNNYDREAVVSWLRSVREMYL